MVGLVWCWCRCVLLICGWVSVKLAMWSGGLGIGVGVCYECVVGFVKLAKGRV